MIRYEIYFREGSDWVCELTLIKTVMLDSEQVGGSPIGHARKLLWVSPIILPSSFLSCLL